MKRGGGIQHLKINDATLLKTIPDITALDDALNELSRVDQRKGRSWRCASLGDSVPKRRQR
jgi:hypothetical protein